MLRYCTGVSEGLNSPQRYCPRLRHPEVINELSGLPSRTTSRQKAQAGKVDPAGAFHAAFTVENTPACQESGPGERGGAGGEERERGLAGTCNCSAAVRTWPRDNGAREVAARPVPAGGGGPSTA